MATTSHALRVIEHVPFHADPILKAIDAHDEAWSVWQVATDAILPRAHHDMESALARLLTTPCLTRFGSVALLQHLRWHVDHDGITDAAVLARASDLALYLNLDLLPVAPPRQPLAPILRALWRCGEMIACLSIIVGGMGLIGLASML
ncbi:hypothetical protein [Methylobacterium soli]|uniref:Uncharacterized protein n=1 Tax=Methylobacterium soli TaxID=553447 RepID=A0A6L3SXQ6_9HYPH|nr:hypothetical protein [Methylobacterium soli]KAB1078243.1 hypothetical protein F6X53_15945 [Methylobacterium soli]